MIGRCVLSLVLVVAASGLAIAAKPAAKPAQKPYQPTAAELQEIRTKTEALEAALKRVQGKRVDDGLLADVEIYAKAAQWIVRYAAEEFYSPRYVADALAGLDRGLARAKELAGGRPSWPKRTGQVVRAYRSQVDDSVQPYGLAIPASYDGRRPVRLDVVLHGRGGTLNEVSFIAAHEPQKPTPIEGDAIRLDVFGRVNNAYRWSGEADVFEALASVQKRYKIDPHKIVLRGFSMGGAGAWHLGLHYPDRWAAVEAGAGFTETKRYAKQDNLPPYQDALLHIYDAADYARNAWNVPFVGYAGEEDSQLQAALNIRQELESEGVAFTRDGMNWLAANPPLRFLVGPKTGHKFHPESKRQSDQFLDQAVDRAGRSPDRLRFVTYTVRYNRCHWITVDGLERHYQRAEVEARRSEGGLKIDVATRNVARLTISDVRSGAALTIDGATLRPAVAPGRDLTLEKTAQGWAVAGAPAGLGKIHGLQGPIDDAFCGSFLCVRPTGESAQKLSHEYAQATCDLFAKEFARWLRGDVRVKTDAEVTPADIAAHHLILFGDPTSNRLIRQIAERLPVRWEGGNLVVGAQRFSAADHALALVYPNPLNPRRYVVLNSGHTFHEADFRGTNALLFPRLGDYAVLKLARSAANRVEATVELSDFFDEQWQLPERKGTSP